MMLRASLVCAREGKKGRILKKRWVGSRTSRVDSRRKPRIAVFSGPQSTVANTAPVLTCNQARKKKGLEEKQEWDGRRLQRLAAPVEVLIAQFSEHPLAGDSAELHGAPDGWRCPENGELSATFKKGWTPYLKATLRPEDGLYLLPYMGMQKDGTPWDAAGERQTFFPDASRLYEEIDLGWDSEGENAQLTSKADFDFYRACPPGGFTQGLEAHDRKDQGDGDISPEAAGRDFFRYYPYHAACPPHADALIKATNVVQKVMKDDRYQGGQWLESSCSIEETLYWFSLIVDTDKPLVGHSAQRPHGVIGSEGDANIVAGVRYIVSNVWKNAAAENKDGVGCVLVVDDRAFAAREVAKTDARPGNYEAVGGHGGVVAGLHLTPTLCFVPARKATWRSEVNLSKLPSSVRGVSRSGPVDVRVVDARGELVAPLPRVEIVKQGHYGFESRERNHATPFNGTRGTHGDVLRVKPGSNLAPGVVADIDHALSLYPLSGFVAEGANPYAYVDEGPVDSALLKAVFSGLPVARVARGHAAGFCYPSGPFFIAGSNLTSTKARILLQAAILKLGMLPPAADPSDPTPSERAAIADKVRAFQHIFDTH